MKLRAWTDALLLVGYKVHYHNPVNIKKREASAGGPEFQRQGPGKNKWHVRFHFERADFNTTEFP
ncbi:hypothetical protein LHL20_06760 [Alteromonas sp. McT4-15]|uniref:hypothetical protein n=1 Tax=Alteromonas sp. McT4-15 TaxID=2881256 RepID=UPI001CF7EF81|nr:hypothetical protein [Alteromonas sp. McT4-15]MCB4435946.1 hypothetical protein [Alteromonas sp. McT4-15]MEC8231732.1 hypothetical protein [Pseudomonadota bacterium]